MLTTAGYFAGIHLFGAIGLVGWIHHANPPNYREYLESQGQDKTWWYVTPKGWHRKR